MVIQTVINVVLLAVVYILMGMGFAFILNLLGIFNLAHGAIFMASSYGCYLLVTRAQLPGFVAFPLTVLAAAAFGILVERFLFRPMGADFNRTMMVCIALSTILVTTFNLFLGTKVLAIPSFIEGTTGIGPYRVQSDRILAFGIGVVILVGDHPFRRSFALGSSDAGGHPEQGRCRFAGHTLQPGGHDRRLGRFRARGHRRRVHGLACTTSPRSWATSRSSRC